MNDVPDVRRAKMAAFMCFNRVRRLPNIIANNTAIHSKCHFSTINTLKTSRKKMLSVGAGLLAASGVGVMYALERSVQASDLELHASAYDWYHNKLFHSFDHSSIRRGYEVYKQVCSACHSLQYVSYRELVDVIMTEDQAKAEAAEMQVEDGPDDTGKMFMRPGKLSDRFPSPYPNEEAARYANNGALPPDLSYIVLARHGGEDYVFSLLTGYKDTPAGIHIEDGQHFNPYFPGGAIGMAQSLFNGVIDYEDGTPAYASQLAKDVTNFLAWTAMPEHNERKKFTLNLLFIMVPMLAMMTYWNRHLFRLIKTRKILFRQKS